MDPSRRRLRVLVVEDDLVDQLALRHVIRDSRLPCHLTMAESVADAAEAIVTGGGFDVIITDYTLCDGTALDVLTIAGDAACIIVTAAGDHEKATSVLKAGAADYLVKDAKNRHLAVLPASIERAVRVKEQARRVKMLVHALRHIGEAVYVSAPDERIVFVNRAFCEMYGWSEAEVMGRATDSLWPNCPVLESGGIDELCTDITLATKVGSQLSVTLTRSMVHDDAGKVVAIVRVMRDMTERDRIDRELREANALLERSRAAFEELAIRDELTGLYNRRELDRRLTAEVARSSRTQHPFSFVLLDVDHFKLVNDRYGHPAGDQVLRQIARIVSGELRVTDTAARYGGEEIGVLLPETSAADAAAVATRLRERLEATTFDLGDGTTFSVTASFGVAAIPGNASTCAELVAAADEALYAAKAGGRNRVECASSELRMAFRAA